MTQRYFIIQFFLLVVVTGFCHSAFAQQDTSKMNQQVEVVKAYRPSVSKAAKIDLLPEISDTTRFRPDLNYQTSSHPITYGFQSSVLKASNQFQREINYPGYGKISGGFGTNFTPFFDFFLSNPNSINGTFGVQMNHLSSQGKVKLKGGNEIDAPFSYNKAAIFGSYVLDGVTIASELSYQRDMNRFFGYPIAIPATIMTNTFVKYFDQNQLNQLGYFDLSVKSNASANGLMKFNTGIRLSYFNTSTNQVEKGISFKGDFIYDFGAFSGKLNTGFEHFETENVTSFSDFPLLFSPKNSWLRLSPTILFKRDLFSFEGGITLCSGFGDMSTKFGIYPNGIFTLNTAMKNLSLYAGVDGSLQNNNYSKIAAENRWINPTLEVNPTNYRYIFYGGVKGKIAAPLAFNLGIKYTQAEEQYFYVTKIEKIPGTVDPTLNDLSYNNAFDVVYDNINTLDFSGDLTYTTSDLFLLLSGHFYSYSLRNLESAPYLPDFTLSGSANFKVTDKIKASAELLFTGPRNIMLQYYYPPYLSSLPPPPIYLKTDAMIEANIGAKYQFMKNLEFMGSVENLLNRKDEPWYGYTVQGIRFKLGASFSF